VVFGEFLSSSLKINLDSVNVEIAELVVGVVGRDGFGA